MSECKHKWIFQETKRKTSTTYDRGGYWTAIFHRVDIYFCERCCEIREVEKKQDVKLPFGGIRHVSDFAPIWY